MTALFSKRRVCFSLGSKRPVCKRRVVIVAKHIIKQDKLCIRDNLEKCADCLKLLKKKLVKL